MWLSTHYACYPSLYLLLYFLGKSISTKKTSNFFTSLYLYIYTNFHTPRSIFTKILGYICNVCLILAFQFGLLYVFLYPSKLLYNFSKFTLPPKLSIVEATRSFQVTYKLSLKSIFPLFVIM